MQYRRKANGPQTYRTPARRAHDVALSIMNRQREGRQWDLARDYGIVAPEMVAMIEQAIEQMQMQHAA